MWELFTLYPWLVPTCLALILVALLWLVWFLVTRTGPDDEVTIWALPVRIAIRRGRARRGTPRPGNRFARVVRALRRRGHGAADPGPRSPATGPGE